MLSTAGAGLVPAVVAVGPIHASSVSKADILPNLVAQGTWKTIKFSTTDGTHTLLKMKDGNVLDWWVPSANNHDDLWRLWSYKPSNTKDVLPTLVSHGKWHTDGSFHSLFVMPDGKVLVLGQTGGWKLYNYTPGNTSDALDTAHPVAQGQWKTIANWHQLLPMKDGKVLDYEAATGKWRLWTYNPSSTKDVLPTLVAQGTWKTLKDGNLARHQLSVMSDGKVLDYDGLGNWRLYTYNPSSTKDVLPTLVAQGTWKTIVSKKLIPMQDGRVLEYSDLSGAWRLWSYAPPR